MLARANIAREGGEPDKAIFFEVWASDALAAGLLRDQPVDPAIAPAPTIGRVARVLASHLDEEEALCRAVALCVAHRPATTDS